MAFNETRVTICGNVASPVTHTKVGTGFSRAKFRLFTAERVWDQEQRIWEDGARMFLSVSCWRMLADNAQASLNKGDPVVVTGRLTIKEVEYEGKTRPVVEIEATAIGPNLAMCTAMPTRTRLAPDAVEARAAPEVAARGMTAREVPAPPNTAPANTAPGGTAPGGTAPGNTAPANTTREVPAPGKAAPRITAPEIVAPRKPDELPLVRTGEAERPKEVAEVPF